MRITLLLLMAIVSSAGCSGTLPPKQSTPMEHYTKLVVRDINWEETALSEISHEDMITFVASQNRLSNVFRSEFAKYITEINFFDTVLYGDAQADAGTLILLPKIYTLKVGTYMPGGSYTGLLITRDGKHVAVYTAERRLKSGSSAMDSIEKLVRELGEDAASELPYAR